MLSFLLSFISVRSPFQFTFENYIQSFFYQKLDHFNSRSNEIFRQKYYTRNSNPTNPKSIVLFLGSESLPNEDFSHSACIYAENNNAALFSLEHRFFGESFPNDTTYLLNKDNLQLHLNSAQVLNDIGNFLQSLLTNTSCSNSDINNTKCDVTIFAGGYLGTIANWFHLKYPHYVTNVITSSSPLSISKTAPYFDLNIYELFSTQNQQCLHNYLEIMTNISKQINQTAIHELFGIPDISDKAFYYAVAEILSKIFVYKDHIDTNLLTKVCSGLVSGDDGIKNLATEFQFLLAYFNETNQSINIEYPQDESLDSPYKDYRSWSWLKCNEIGLWHEASKDSKKRFRNKDLTEQYFNEVCQTLFGKDLTVVDSFTYGSKELPTTNTILINGDKDPMLQSFLLTSHPAYLQYSLLIENKSRLADMGSNPDTNTTIILSKAFDFINTWTSNINDNYKKCEHGYRSFGECTCKKGYGGAECQHLMHPEKSFKVITILSVAVPTLLLLIIGAGVWLSGRHEDNEIGARPTLYT